MVLRRPVRLHRVRADPKGRTTMGQVMWHCVVAVTGLILNGVATATLPQSESPSVVQRTLVFFDWGKPEVGKDAAEQLEKVVSSYRARPGRLLVTGHSDRSGSAAGNLRSAALRAQAVVDYLVERGVPRSTMSVASLGEERPLIPTADGVREPQNRRVEIVVSDAKP